MIQKDGEPFSNFVTGFQHAITVPFTVNRQTVTSQHDILQKVEVNDHHGLTAVIIDTDNAAMIMTN